MGPSFELDQKPVWYELYPPHDYQTKQTRAKGAWKGLIGYLLLTIWVTALSAYVKPEWISSVVLLAGVGLSILFFVRTRRAFTILKRNYESQYQAARVEFERASADWERRVAEHDRAERLRVDSAPLWHPVLLTGRPSRVDVFGGTADSWASLLATAGSAMLASGTAVLVLDFTEQAVADNLALLADAQGHPVRVNELPRDLLRLRLFDGLDSAELAEVAAESIYQAQGPSHGGDSRALHAALLTAVAERLDGPAVFARLAAALQVLRRAHEVASGSVLTAAEVRRLTDYLDTAGKTDLVANELQTLAVACELVAREEPAMPEGTRPEGFGAVWPIRGLSVIATSTTNQRRKNLLDQIVFQRTLHELRNRRAVGRELLVVAGADQLGLANLEMMARQARRSGVRLVFLFEHLRDELQKLLGGADSASLIMRLGNATEAAAAADFIGRGHRFVLSELTKQTGSTFTTGDSYSTGEQRGVSHTRGYTHGGGFTSSPDGGSSSSTWSSTRSTTHSRSQTWQETTNRSQAESSTAGTSLSRVYEYVVEPTTLQGLEPTAFLLVETGMAGRRVVLGDCNPGIALLDRLARSSG